MGKPAVWGDWIYRALTFLVISCPCALVISIPLSFFAGIGGASNQGILVKGSNYLETLAQTKYVVFDKTGTMTQGVFEVSGIHHNEMPDEKCLDTPTSGDYYLDGVAVRTMSKSQRAVLRNRKIGFIFQNYNLLAKTTSVENVELPLMYNPSITPQERFDRSVAALKAVGLGERLYHKSNQMSGGQMQRVAIARALVNNPAVILADEATGNLDTRTSFEILVLFQKLHAEGRTIIFVTHNPDIAHYASRNIELRDGRIIRNEVNDHILSAAEGLAALPKNTDE